MEDKEIKVKDLGKKGTWREVANAARTTVSMKEGEGEPSSEWKRDMLLSEHSPIRKINIMARIYNIPYFSAMHIRTHWLGIEQFISTQRTDRTGVDRTEKNQDAPVVHEIDANMQSIINISQERLCEQADDTTIEVWKLFLEEVVKPNEPELYSVCVPKCIYRGFCPELNSCGWNESEEYEEQLKEYRNK